MHDIIRESPYYQEILKEGREEGLEKGREEGMLEALRQTIIDIVVERFPDCFALPESKLHLSRTLLHCAMPL